MELSERLPYVLLMILSATISMVVAILAFRSRRKVARAMPFAIMALYGSAWMVLVSFETLATNLALKELLWGLIPFFILCTLAGLFFFSLEFSFRLIRAPKIVLFTTITAILVVTVLSVTNPIHHQLWTVDMIDGKYIQVMGSFFPIQLGVTYLLAFGSLALLVRAHLLSKGLLRRQTVFLLVGILIPVLVSIAADVFGWNPLPFVDEPAFSIVFAVVLFGWATLGFNTFYLLPVASDVIIKNMLDGVLVTDVEGLIIFGNQSAQQILGKTDALLHGFPVARVLADWNPEAFHAWNAGKEEVQLIIGQEEAQYFRLATSKLAVNSGEPIGSLLTFYNNSDQKNYEKRLNELAICDPLTGSYNRRYFYEMAHIYFNQMLRSSKPLSLIMLDLDHFKNINDTFGHLKGDLVIQQVVAVCKHLVRNQDIFSRYGGEEFILAMPETSLRDALLVAERLRKAIEALNNEADGFPITASLGVVESIGETWLTLDGLIHRADEAMYSSKHAGRNCVTAWTDKGRKKILQPGGGSAQPPASGS